MQIFFYNKKNTKCASIKPTKRPNQISIRSKSHNLSLSFKTFSQEMRIYPA